MVQGLLSSGTSQQRSQQNQFAFTLPRDDHRSTILGKTGSGKTLAAIWQLSHRSLDRKPWVILDFKRDKSLNKLGASEMALTSLPRHPGLYISHPLPDDRALVDEFLWRVWEKEKIGLVFDEGYMVSGLKSFRAVLTQGRSKSIPCIICSQRPTWLDRFVFSESDFFQLFWLNDRRDRKTTQSFLPFDVDERLEDYHSHWYDVPRDQTFRLAPVPGETEIRQAFRERMGRQRKAI